MCPWFVIPPIKLQMSEWCKSNGSVSFFFLWDMYRETWQAAPEAEVSVGTFHPTDVSLVRVPALALHPTQFDADNGWNRCQEAVGLYCQISNHSVRDFPRYWHNITYFLLVLSHSADCLSVASLFLLKGLPGNDASLYTLLQLYTLNTVERSFTFLFISCELWSEDSYFTFTITYFYFYSTTVHCQLIVFLLRRALENGQELKWAVDCPNDKKCIGMQKWQTISCSSFSYEDFSCHTGLWVITEF